MLIILMINIQDSLRKVADKLLILLSVTPVVANTTFSGISGFAKFVKPLGAQLIEPLFYYFTSTKLLTTKLFKPC